TEQFQPLLPPLKTPRWSAVSGAATTMAVGKFAFIGLECSGRTLTGGIDMPESPGEVVGGISTRTNTNIGATTGMKVHKGMRTPNSKIKWDSGNPTGHGCGRGEDRFSSLSLPRTSPLRQKSCALCVAVHGGR